MDRRDWLSGSLLGAAVAGFPQLALPQGVAADSRQRPWDIIDANVSLFHWPFRRLPYDSTEQLVEKLKSLAISQAWAGSFEGLLHRDVSGVNSRLAQACRQQGDGLLVAFGSINPTLPDWEEDLRRCDEMHRMPGIRIHPNYHGYTLEDARFARLLESASERGMLVQLATAMEDRRTQHPKLQVPDVDLEPLPALLKKVPDARVLILNFRPKGEIFRRLAETESVYFDTARVEATDGVASLAQSVTAGRVVFGTHAPFLIYESSLIRVYESQLAEQDTHAVFAENARRLITNSSLQ